MKKLLVAFFSLLLVLFGMTRESNVQAAEKYPVKPITFIVPVDAGGGLDLAIRPFCEKLGVMLGQPVMVVNKPGAGSSIGYRTIHDAKPDGYTIGAATGTLITNKLQGLLPYDYHDLTVLGANQQGAPIIVAATKGKRTFKTLKEVIEFSKSHPEEVTMAAGAKGQSWWIIAMDFQSVSEAKFNIIPQEAAGGVSMAQVAGGHVDLGVVTLGEAKPQIVAGNARPLAIIGSKRLSLYPDVPCTVELGYNVRSLSTTSIVGPPNIPKEITDILCKAVEAVSKDPDYIKYLEEKTNLAITIPYWPPDQTIKEFDKQREILREIMRKAGILKEK